MPITATTSALTSLADPAKGAPAWTTYLSLVLASLSVTAVLANFLRTHLRDRRNDRYEYAEKVAAWTGPDIGNAPAAGHYRYDAVVVNNGSDQPIYDVVVCLPTAEPGELVGESDILNVPVGLVPPGEQVAHTVGDIGAREQYAKPLSVYFADGRGRRWHRDESGRLHHRGRLRLVPRQPRVRKALTGTPDPA